MKKNWNVKRILNNPWFNSRFIILLHTKPNFVCLNISQVIIVLELLEIYNVGPWSYQEEKWGSFTTVANSNVLAIFYSTSFLWPPKPPKSQKVRHSRISIRWYRLDSGKWLSWFNLLFLMHFIYLWFNFKNTAMQNTK